MPASTSSPQATNLPRSTTSGSSSTISQARHFYSTNSPSATITPKNTSLPLPSSKTSLYLNPHRLDGLDHYSNILYVMADRPRLAFLAHLATSVDKFRPESCCVVGNYYSLCSQHEKAVMYFRRALTLDRNFLSAWTLMGHEYIELKNTHAAIESYRRAVDVNRKDYRAWYGLGQAYEVLDMGFYALFYYQRAAGLRPYDPKMWQAVGSCYAKMEKLDSAIRALKRALVAGTYFEESKFRPIQLQPKCQCEQQPRRHHGTRKDYSQDQNTAATANKPQTPRPRNTVPDRLALRTLGI